MDVCVICFDKKRHFFIYLKSINVGGGYFKGYTKSALHYYELNDIFGLH